MKTVLLILSVLFFASCNVYTIPNIKKPSYREIDRAMSYSSWEYILPKHNYHLSN